MNAIGFQELGSTPKDAALFSVSFKSFHESAAPSSPLEIASNLNVDDGLGVWELIGSESAGWVVRMDIVMERRLKLVSTILYALRPYVECTFVSSY